jgi:hypothetical protein
MMIAVATTGRRIQGLTMSGGTRICIPSAISRETPLQTRLACGDAASAKGRTRAVFQHQALSRIGVELGLALGQQQLMAALAVSAAAH